MFGLLELVINLFHQLILSVLWEMFTFGTHPYEGWNLQKVGEEVLRGYRLPQPEKCPNRLYLLMLSMW